MDEREFSPLPAEFSAPPPEAAPLPPEFGQTSGPQTGTKSANRKRIKWLYAIAVILIAAIANGNIGGTSAPVPPDNPVVIEQPGEEGDPTIFIDYAYYTPAASSDFSMVDYSYSIDPNETSYPIRVYAKVVDGKGKEAVPETDPDIWDSDRDLLIYSMETTGLSETGMKLVITAEFEKDGETRQVAVSKAVEREVFPEVSIEIDYAKYIPAVGGNPAFVGYSYTIKTDDDSIYPISVHSFLEDGSGTVKGRDGDPAVIDKGAAIDEYQILPAGLKGDLKLSLSAEFAYRNGSITIFAESPVDMSAKADEPEPEPQTWPLGDGMVFITVYNNSFDFESADDPLFPMMKILLHEEMNEADWQDITLPDAYDPNEDWDPAGFILHYNGEFDFGYDNASEYSEFVHVLEGNVLTKEDIELVPPTADGSRYVNVHVMWYPLRNYDFKLRLELALNDGTDDAEVWEADQPFASEGYTYLAVFGEPERDGYTFTGWYDAEGNKVDYVSYYDFFDPLPDAQTREDRDWEHPKTVRLTAGWE